MPCQLVVGPDRAVHEQSVRVLQIALGYGFDVPEIRRAEEDLAGIDVFDPNPDSIPAMRGMAVRRIRRGLAPERDGGDDPSKNAEPAPNVSVRRRAA